MEPTPLDRFVAHLDRRGWPENKDFGSHLAAWGTLRELRRWEVLGAWLATGPPHEDVVWSALTGRLRELRCADDQALVEALWTGGGAATGPLLAWLAREGEPVAAERAAGLAGTTRPVDGPRFAVSLPLRRWLAGLEPLDGAVHARRRSLFVDPPVRADSVTWVTERLLAHDLDAPGIDEALAFVVVEYPARELRDAALAPLLRRLAHSGARLPPGAAKVLATVAAKRGGSHRGRVELLACALPEGADVWSEAVLAARDEDPAWAPQQVHAVLVARLPDASEAAALRTLYGALSPAVRVALLGTRSDALVDADWVEAVASSDRVVRMAAAGALVDVGPAAEGWLLTLATDPEPAVALAALTSLSALATPRARGALLGAMGRPELAARARQLLARLDPADAGAPGELSLVEPVGGAVSEAVSGGTLTEPSGSVAPGVPARAPDPWRLLEAAPRRLHPLVLPTQLLVGPDGSYGFLWALAALAPCSLVAAATAVGGPWVQRGLVGAGVLALILAAPPVYGAVQRVRFLRSATFAFTASVRVSEEVVDPERRRSVQHHDLVVVDQAGRSHKSRHTFDTRRENLLDDPTERVLLDPVTHHVEPCDLIVDVVVGSGGRLRPAPWTYPRAIAVLAWWALQLGLAGALLLG
jgi:hypothetical protein